MTQVVKAPDGRTLPVESWGDPDGKPVFLLHGTPGGRYGPRPRGIVLYRLGIRLISYDRPGYPHSTRKINRTVADAADDVIAIADYFGIDQFSVVGRSGGAPHALACAALRKDRVICAAALGSLAPYDAEGFNWSEGMADSNVRAYRDAELNVPALIATLNEQAGQVRNNPEGLLELLWPELVGDDRNVVGNIAIRRIIAETHAKALRETADGWIDDVIALSRPWDFKPSEITVPVMLWHGGNDVFSPVQHTYWLKEQIKTAELDVEPEAAHFGAVESLPKILTWIATTVNAETRSVLRATALRTAGHAV